MKFIQLTFIGFILVSVVHGFGLLYGNQERRSSEPQTSLNPLGKDIDKRILELGDSASTILMRILDRIEKLQKMKQAEEETRQQLLRGKIGLRLPMFIH